MAEGLYREGAQAGADAAIRAYNFGGLNTEASPLNIPTGDSTQLTNCIITPGGNVQKRKGTKVVFTDTTNANGQSLFSITTPQGNVLSIRKAGTSITVNRYLDVITQIKEYTNVFNSAATTEQPTVVDISTPNEPKYLLLTGRNVPIQITVLESTGTIAPSGTSVSTTDTRFYNAATDFTTVFVLIYQSDGTTVLTSPTGGSYASETATFTGLTSAHTGGNYDLISVSWQWWAEGYWYDGDRFYTMIPRFGVNAVDRHLALPERIRDGLANMRTLPVSGNPMIVAHRRLDTGGVQAYTWNPSLAANDQYILTDGSPAYMVQSFMFTANAGTTHITFGGNSISGYDTSAQSGSPTHIHRLRELRFRGGTPWRADRTVAVIGFKENQTWGSPLGWTTGSTPNVSFSYAWTSWNNSGVPVSVSSNYTSRWVSFSVGGVSTGIPQTRLVKFVHYDTDYKGSNSLNDPSPYKHRGIVVAYGLGEYADYRMGYFPTCGAVQEGRLYLGGFPHRPLDIIASAILDVNVPGEYFQDFQIDAFTSLDGAKDYLAISTVDDYIVGMISMAGSLFVYTRKTVQRFRPTDVGFRPEIVGTKGATNSQAIQRFADRMTFVSDDGVYECRNMEGLSDNYGLVEISGKVASIFRKRQIFRHVLEYDDNNRQLFITMGNFLMVWNSELNAWYRWEIGHQWEVLNCTQIENSQLRNKFTITVRIPRTGGNRVYVLETDGDYYLDAMGSWGDTEVIKPSQTINTVANVRVYAHTIPTTGIESVEDLRVELDGVPLTFKTQWRKRRNTIYLIGMPNPGLPLVIQHRNVDLESTSSLVTQPNTNIKGFAYFSIYNTPTFTWNVLANFKRLLHFEGLFNNAIQNGLYTLGEVLDTDENEFWVGYPRVELDCNVTFAFNHEKGGDTSYELYRFYDLVWDYSLFDVTGSIQNDDDYVLIREYIQGVGYAFQALVWNTSHRAFSLTGYQIKGEMKGSRYRRE
jgi:hypothetical protein